MDPAVSISEALPELYRSILLLVEELERSDGRVEAARIRREAIEVYGRGWDVAQRRRLEQLRARLRRSLEARRAPSRRWLRLP